MLNKRTNILFDQLTWGVLKQTSQARDTSISELIRLAVKKMYLEQERGNERQQLLAEIKALAKNVDLTGISYKELINDGRRF